MKEIEGLNSYEEVFEFLFGYLSSKPLQSNWNGGPLYMGQKEKNNINLWIGKMEAERNTYPGWLILPVIYQDSFSDAVDNLISITDRIKDATIHQRLHFLYELDWRLTISLTPKCTDEYIAAISEVVYTEEMIEEGETEMQFSLANSLLSSYRYLGKQEDFDKLVDYIKTKFSHVYTRQCKRLTYEEGLMALWKLDFKRVGEIVDNWKIVFDDFEPVLWKAMLLYEIGRAEEAVHLLSNANKVIEQMMLTEDEPSAYVKSCKLQIEKSLNYYRRDVMSFSELLDISRATKIEDSRYIYDFGMVRDRIFSDFSKKQDWKEREETHDFDIGRVNTNWNSMYGFVPNYMNPFRLILLHDAIGYPFAASASMFVEMIPKFCVYTYRLSIMTIILCGVEDMVKKAAKRELFCVIRRDDADRIFDFLMERYHQYENSKTGRVHDRIHSAILPFLARLSICVSQDRVIQIIGELKGLHDLIRANYQRTPYNCINDESSEWALEQFMRLPVLSRSEILPEVFKMDVKLSKEAMENCIAALLGDDHQATNNAYHRLEHYYSYFNSEAKAAATNAIKEWRNKGNMDLYKMESIFFVPWEEDESWNPIDIVKQRIKEFLSQQHEIKKDSPSITDFHDKVAAFGILFKYITDEDKVKIVCKILDVLKGGEKVLKDNDSKELLFGLRKFSESMMYTIERLLILSLPVCDDDLKDRIGSAMSDYEAYGFPLLAILIRVNRDRNRDDVVAKYIQVLIKKVTSENRSEKEDVFRAAEFLRKGDVSDDDLNKLYSYIEYSRRATGKYVISFMTSLLLYEVISYEQFGIIKKALDIVEEDDFFLAMSEDEKSDFVYECMKLVGVITTKHPEWFDKESKEKWQELLVDGETFNDQLQGYYKGRALVYGQENMK